MSKNNSGPHVKLTAPHVEEKARIDCLVSREVKEMWEEIVAKDREISKQRYYPAHTLERMIRADYQIMKTFGVQGRKKKK
ncbi:MULTISPECIES: hypothetical protein [Enterococcus]|uniref:hypothetical protein n=1 Tax=Enterococcus TaxID=1350 RepID=UPI00070DC67C|nr:hypothetical protein [Enterococcus faecalis]EGO5066622.1 hypothetical protein [Enterococcus faecalis]EGO5077001.1 hypothetical protein [Enterococcus faecalis]KXF70040.1 hypothetical protein AQ486_10745 [Enterococcus faecalis]KXF73996.1 hypothetical protein AQ487_03770 [Enterococcus faecalis]MBC2812175.1 hypothetical protein [Enterococcus faecalis]